METVEEMAAVIAEIPVAVEAMNKADPTTEDSSKMRANISQQFFYGTF